MYTLILYCYLGYCREVQKRERPPSFRQNKVLGTRRTDNVTVRSDHSKQNESQPEPSFLPDC